MKMAGGVLTSHQKSILAGERSNSHVQSPYTIKNNVKRKCKNDKGITWNEMVKCKINGQISQVQLVKEVSNFKQCNIGYILEDCQGITSLKETSILSM